MGTASMGFEIIAATRQANNTDDLLLVKGGCLSKLHQQAIANGIVDHARVNAEETGMVFDFDGVRVERVMMVGQREK
jgi:hypothetical protein